MTSLAIIGAGYAGLLAANRAAARGHRVTLVNERDTFIDRIRLHEYIAGSRPRHRTVRPLRPLLHPKVDLRVDRATAYETGRVTLRSGRPITADHILLATGSSAGAGNWEWATRARDQVDAVTAGATATVLGGGFTGLEVAAELVAVRPEVRVTLVDPRGAGAAMSPGARQRLGDSLSRLGVEVTASAPATSEVTIDCTGFTHDDLTGGSVLDVDEFLRVPGLDRVWAAGDAVRVAGQPHLRMACATAEPMAALAIDQIERTAASAALKPVSIGYAGWCLSLGRRDGLIQFVNRDDTPTERVWSGRRAALAKETVCRFAVVVPVGWARWYRALNGPTHA